ncbi:hypothetical protein PGTUg99_032461 [Puccinia graminis f. sp. tritici]|uniref:Uncharacterized protein n=1 Tax=Puccinia graminis f. sp. tritici TaxID=56615 RepID=A0A5B0RPG6_PUCGR|nr:hypothetical protein PGTUg99_032461 [Puccinia graminis f. sp. tritici]
MNFSPPRLSRTDSGKTFDFEDEVYSCPALPARFRPASARKSELSVTVAVSARLKPMKGGPGQW